MPYPTPRRNLLIITGLTVLMLLHGIPATSWGNWFSRDRDLKPTAPAFLLAVGDPLAFENACPCIKSYAQRDYHLVAELVTREINRPVELVFSQTPESASQRAGRWPDCFIGKTSVAEMNSRAKSHPARRLAMLSDLNGKTTLQGLFVVRQEDPARAVPDLAGRTILFGPSDSSEKHSAALALLNTFGLPVSSDPPEADPCTAAAQKVLKKEADAAVISDYAWPLLAACGAAESGSLRIVGRTDPVPFVGVFATAELKPADEAGLRRALNKIARSRRLRERLETRDGFIMTTSAAAQSTTPGWTDWRGSLARDAFRENLPAIRSTLPRVIWRHPLQGQSLGGLAATPDKVIIPDKSETADQDLWHCLRTDTGETLWTVSYPAAAEMDYTSAPRATPVIVGDKVYLSGALGDLLCVDLGTGAVLWHINLIKCYGGTVPTWGFCGTPLIIGNRLIIQTGNKRSGLVALNRQNGREVWRCPGSLPSYGSFIFANLGGLQQIVGHDSDSLGGWDPETGRRLWRLVPPVPNDFNVPTPAKVGDMLLVSTENNGTRLYGFNDDGSIRPKPWSTSQRLAPDVSSPVLLDGLVWGADQAGIHVLRVASKLAPVWESSDNYYTRYMSLIAGPSGILASALSGSIYMFGLPPGTTIQPTQVFSKKDEFLPEMWSHPALVGHRLYLRSSTEAACVELEVP
ncbi:MAG: PhnD/SsuA/transferrin family substrate-binding protein [bacterium]